MQCTQNKHSEWTTQLAVSESNREEEESTRKVSLPHLTLSSSFPFPSGLPLSSILPLLLSFSPCFSLMLIALQKSQAEARTRPYWYGFVEKGTRSEKKKMRILRIKAMYNLISIFLKFQNFKKNLFEFLWGEEGWPSPPHCRRDSKVVTQVTTLLHLSLFHHVHPLCCILLSSIVFPYTLCAHHVYPQCYILYWISYHNITSISHYSPWWRHH